MTTVAIFSEPWNLGAPLTNARIGGSYFPQASMVEHNGLPGLGTRLSICSSICTVKYIGPVDGTNGTWLGVEWDDSGRGKHSGSHQGRAYFTTRYLPVASGREAGGLMRESCGCREFYSAREKNGWGTRVS